MSGIGKKGEDEMSEPKKSRPARGWALTSQGRINPYYVHASRRELLKSKVYDWEGIVRVEVRELPSKRRPR